MGKLSHEYRRQIKATKPGAFHRRGAPGTKIGRAIERAIGIKKDDRGNRIFHGGELTAANLARAIKRASR